MSDSSSQSSLDAQLLPEQSLRQWLPVPTPGHNLSRTSFTLSETNSSFGRSETNSAEPNALSLPPDVAGAQLSIAADGTFVETTSAGAARELKRRYDQLLGVGKDGVRSPYTITSIVNQVGTRVFRVCHQDRKVPSADPRENSLPPPTPEEILKRENMGSLPKSSRPSVVNLLASTSVFKTASKKSARQSLASSVEASSISTRQKSSTMSHPRKSSRLPSNTRSIPDLGRWNASLQSANASAPHGADDQSADGHGRDTPVPTLRPISNFGSLLAPSVVLADEVTLDKTIPQTVDKPFGDYVSFQTPVFSAAATLPPPEAEPVSPTTTSTSSESNDDVATHTLPPRSVSILSSPISPILRGAQSFESTLTARAPKASSYLGDLAMSPASILSEDLAPSSSEDEREWEPTYYSSTQIFDVLQNSKGLPLITTVPEWPADATFKLQPSSSVAPKDDPRFVLWGTRHEEEKPQSDYRKSASSAGRHPSPSSNKPTMQKKSSIFGTMGKSSSAGGHKSKSSTTTNSTASSSRSSSAAPSLSPSFDNSQGPGSVTTAPSDEPEGRRVMLAATIERWVAQLTSEFNYDELLDFFLTYRTYITPVDLAHLFICRFQWALNGTEGVDENDAEDVEDVTVRRIVRVRTFIAVRYWLLTFFKVDFIANKQLCVVLTTWLNALGRSPLLQSHADALGMVRKLKKIVRDCKVEHSREGKSKLPSSKRKLSANPTGETASLSPLGDTPQWPPIMAAILAEAQKGPDLPGEDTDVDLDFSTVPTPTDELAAAAAPTIPSGPFLTTRARAGSGTLDGPFGQILPQDMQMSPSQASLLQPLHLAIPIAAKSSTGPGSMSSLSPASSNSSALPMQHSKVSRAFVNTIGKLGRWKRVLNNRSAVPTALNCADASEFDLELNPAGDLLTVRGGLEQYLKMMDLPPLPEAHTPRATARDSADDVDEDDIPEQSLDGSQETDVLDIRAEEESMESIAESDAEPEPEVVVPHPIVTAEPLSAATELAVAYDVTEPLSPTAANDGEQTLDSVVESSGVEPTHDTESLVSSFAEREVHSGELLTEEQPYSPYRNHARDSIDSWASSQSSFGELLPHRPLDDGPVQFNIVSLDDYDFSDSEDGSEGGSRLHRMPRRLPNRRDFEFAHRSVNSTSSLGNTSSASGGTSEDPRSGDILQRQPRTWDILPIRNLSHEELGDVEHALLKLEGKVKPDTSNISKIDTWMQRVAERMALEEQGQDFTAVDEALAAELEAELAEDYPSDEDGEAHDIEDELAKADSEDLTIRTSLELPKPPAPVLPSEEVTPWETQELPVPPPIVEIESNRPRAESSASQSASLTHSIHRPGGKFVTSRVVPAVHRSFLLEYRSEVLAEHFCAIERELFLAVKFDQLVSRDRTRSTDDLVILDWEHFLKDRMKRKVAARDDPTVVAENDIMVVQARFNLVSNFTASEIILTPPADRPDLVSKLIRVAWKSFRQNNLATLLALIIGLRSRPVSLSMGKLWSRVGMWEMRVFTDLKAYTSHDDNFKYMRETLASLAEQRQSAKIHDLVKQPECVPFIGIYLNELNELDLLPDYIDPSAPHTTMIPHAAISSSFLHPEVFSTLAPLPDTIPLTPLINIQKQRLIAALVKSVVAGQHLASNCQFKLDRKLYQKCLRLRCLDPDTLLQAAPM